MSLTIATSNVHDHDDFPFDPVVFESVWRMEERHFWHAARNEWILEALRDHGVRPPARLLDVGCGSGAVACFLSRQGYRVTGIDTCVELLEKANLRCPEGDFIAGDVAALEATHEAVFDAVGFFDVLEHLEDPVGFVQSAAKCLRPGGLVLATVPALRWLHSAIDDLAGHKRRFDRGELGELLASAGLKRSEEYGIFRASLPVLAIFRLGARRQAAHELSEANRREMLHRNLRVLPRPINRAMALLCAAERRLGLARARGKVGATALAAAYKSTETTHG